MQLFKPKKHHGSGATTLMISNDEIEHIMSIFKSLEESGLLIKRISETIKNEAKNKKVDFFQLY